VVDDHADVVDILVDCLRHEGYAVLGAWTSAECLKRTILFRPDLVLLDIGMPGMNGIELLERIRAIHPSAGVVMVTANADPQLARQALELGARAYVDKPFDLAYLKRVVAATLREVWDGAARTVRP
jgi:CheY-like chemotaxis protein